MKKIPKSITVITGDQHKVAEIIDNFFIETKDHLLNKFGANPQHLEIRLEGTYQKPNALLENNVHMLLYKEKVIATVIETRTSFNNVHYDFFRNMNNFIR
ncbi:MAG: hypothetical protein V1886_03340 [archaeon]